MLRAPIFLRGFNHWLQRTGDNRYWAVLGNPGMAVGDVNGDGLEDLYVCQEKGLPNRLFVQNADGSARDIASSAGVDFVDHSRSALLIDLDNDGDQDLVLAVQGGLLLAENDGNGHFAVRNVVDTSEDLTSIAAADYDNDGRLDIFASAYNRERLPAETNETAIGASGENLVLYDAKGGGANSLMRNEIDDGGDWKFSDVTSDVGLNVDNDRFTLAASWEDFDNDGDQDLYVGNDYGPNGLYRNDNGQFVDVSEEAGVRNHAFGMSVSWSDYDRDGLADLYVGNMYSSAGNRITFQDTFKADVEMEVKARFQNLARGNSLFRNLGNGKFVDQAMPTGTEMGRWSWSSNFVDINSDGWDDLIVSNGFITAGDRGDL